MKKRGKKEVIFQLAPISFFFQYSSLINFLIIKYGNIFGTQFNTTHQLISIEFTSYFKAYCYGVHSLVNAILNSMNVFKNYFGGQRNLKFDFKNRFPIFNRFKS